MSNNRERKRFTKNKAKLLSEINNYDPEKVLQTPRECFEEVKEEKNLA